MTPNLTITADQAERSAQRMVRSMNQGRRIPKLPESLQRWAEENTIHIFNVGPWRHEIPLGSLGTFLIPKCEKGKPFAAMRALPGIVVEPIPTDERNMELRQEDGRYIAEQIVGYGKHRGKENDLRPYGVFVAAGKKPTPEEVEAARELLHQTYGEMVAEARSAHGQGEKVFVNVYRPGYHDVAAREMNLLDEAWLTKTNPSNRQKCEGCGTMVERNVMVCPSCKFILDEEKYKKHQARFAK